LEKSDLGGLVLEKVIARILDLIDHSGLNDKQILKKLNISNTSTITDWRSGKSKSPSAQNIIKFSNFFNVSTDYILTGKEKYNVLTPDEIEWLNLYKKLSAGDEHFKDECIGFVKGYVKRGETVQKT
jgi:transcriptional regulator with XRE-family HTH domain